jgi:hypothetical protein
LEQCPLRHPGLDPGQKVLFFILLTRIPEALKRKTFGPGSGAGMTEGEELKLAIKNFIIDYSTKTVISRELSGQKKAMSSWQ